MRSARKRAQSMSCVCLGVEREACLDRPRALQGLRCRKLGKIGWQNVRNVVFYTLDGACSFVRKIAIWGNAGARAREGTVCPFRRALYPGITCKRRHFCNNDRRFAQFAFWRPFGCLQRAFGQNWPPFCKKFVVLNIIRAGLAPFCPLLGAKGQVLDVQSQSFPQVAIFGAMRSRFSDVQNDELFTLRPSILPKSRFART